MGPILYFSRRYSTHDHRFLAAIAEGGYHTLYLRLEQTGAGVERPEVPPGVEEIPWQGLHGDFTWGKALELLPSLRAILKSARPALVHAGPLQRAAWLVAKAGLAPLVSMSWGYDLIVDAQRDPTWQRATRFALEHSRLMIGDSQVVRRLAVAHGMREQDIVTFPWGIDLAHFSPASGNRDETGLRRALGWGPDVFVVLSTRAWEPVYGVDVVARAFSSAAKEHPNMRLLMLGGGSRESELRAILAGAGVLHQVEFSGRVPQSDLPRYYQSADLYVSASHSDGTSISLLEALACGTPAAVSDIPGNCEWIAHGQTGWLFPDGDAVVLAELMAGIAAKAGGHPEISAAAREMAEQRADWRANVRHLLGAYARALDGAS